MTRVVLAYPWTDPDGIEHEPDEPVELDEGTAKNLIRDGKARAATAPLEAEPSPPVAGPAPQKSTPAKGAAPQPTDPKE